MIPVCLRAARFAGQVALPALRLPSHAIRRGVLCPATPGALCQSLETCMWPAYLMVLAAYAALVEFREAAATVAALPRRVIAVRWPAGFGRVAGGWPAAGPHRSGAAR